MAHTNSNARLVSGPVCIELLFDEKSKPSLRTWNNWKARRIVPSLKIGGKVYFDPEMVRRALTREERVRS
jgi:hypothetical protein